MENRTSRFDRTHFIIATLFLITYVGELGTKFFAGADITKVIIIVVVCVIWVFLTYRIKKFEDSKKNDT